MRATEGVSAVMLVPPGRWAVDPERSMVGFEVRHLKLTKVRGRFHHLWGVIRCGTAGMVSITGSIDVASIDTGDSRRDARLRREDFFDVLRFPTITVKVVAPAVPTEDGVAVQGTMTIRDVERPLELLVDGPSTPVDGNGELRIRARGELSRRAFGLDWDPAFAAGGLVIDDRVALVLDVVVVPAPRPRPS